MAASWADQVEQGEGGHELPGIVLKGNSKIVTEYITKEDGKKYKVVKYYRLEKKRVPTVIARRKKWKKYGNAVHDPPGPNPANTINCNEEIFMQFITNKVGDKKPEDDALSKLKGLKIVRCRICKEDHWTTHCPYKDKLGALPDILKEENQTPVTASSSTNHIDEKVKQGKYVPPSMREGAINNRGESMNNPRNRDESATIRVTNLSEDVRDSDLQELLRPFGTIARLFLAKDKVTGQSKGFAFVNFYRREDAASAIKGVNGFGYDNLILNVEWAKPSGTP